MRITAGSTHQRRYYKTGFSVDKYYCITGTLARVPGEVEKLFKDYDADMSVPSLAIRFAASLDHVMVVLFRMSNIGQMVIPCIGCSYCTGGCPKKIAIPQYFSLYNEDMREYLEEKGWTVNFTNYDILAGKFGRAKDCFHTF